MRGCSCLASRLEHSTECSRSDTTLWRATMTTEIICRSNDGETWRYSVCDECLAELKSRPWFDVTEVGAIKNGQCKRCRRRHE